MPTVDVKLRWARSSSFSSSRSALLFLRRLKNSSRTLTTIALMLTPSDFGPLLKRDPGLCADMKELRIGKPQTRLASLLNLHFFPINLAQSEKHNPGQIALHARFLRDCFSQINRKPERHSWLVVSRLLRFFDRSPGFLLHCHKWTSRFHSAFSLSLQKASAFCPPRIHKARRMLITRTTSSIMTRHNCHARRGIQVLFQRFYPMANLPAAGDYGTL